MLRLLGAGYLAAALVTATAILAFHQDAYWLNWLPLILLAVWWTAIIIKRLG